MSSANPSENRPQDQQATAKQPEDTTAKLYGSLEWRSLGPYRGGRVVAVSGDMEHKQVFYFGSTGGGVWKTSDGGLYWENVSDGFFKRASVGAIAVAPSDANVIYVGMGKSTIRGNVSHGDGVYKSTDAGKTWRIWDWRTHGRLAACASTHRILIWSMLPPWDTPTAQTGSAASIVQVTAAEPGSRCCSPAKMLARTIWRWTRITRAYSMPRSGVQGVCHTSCRAAAKAAASINPPTAAIAGRRSRTTRDCQRAWSARSASPFQGEIWTCLGAD